MLCICLKIKSTKVGQFLLPLTGFLWRTTTASTVKSDTTLFGILAKQTVIMKGEKQRLMFSEIFFSWINIKSHFKLWSGFFWDFATSRKLPTFHSTCQLPQSVFISSYHLCLGWKCVSQTELPATELLSGMFGERKKKKRQSEVTFGCDFHGVALFTAMQIKITSEVGMYFSGNFKMFAANHQCCMYCLI